MPDFDTTNTKNQDKEESSVKPEIREESQDILERQEGKDNDNNTILSNPVANPLWLSVSEAAKICGVSAKTIRRAITAGDIRYKIYKNRYLIGLRSLIIYLHSNKKLQNKLYFNGIGQYIKGWKK